MKEQKWMYALPQTGTQNEDPVRCGRMGKRFRP